MEIEKLKKVIDGIRAITSSLNLDELLMKIVSNTRNVFHAGFSSYLQLYDPKTNFLVTKAYSGLNENILLFKTRIGESITGKTFQDGVSNIYYTSEGATDGMANLSKKNLNILNDSFLVKDKMPVTVLCTPVIIDDRPIGVLTIHVYTKSHSPELDFLLLEGFAAQVAVAIQNAQFHEDMKNKLAEVINLGKQLKEKNDLLLERNQIHDTLFQHSLQNKGVDTIVRELERLLSVPVAFFNDIEDKFYSGQQKKFNSLSIEKLTKLTMNQKPMQIDANYNKKYYIYPLTSKENFLRCLVLDITETPMTPSDHIAIEQGGTILMLELAKQQTLTELYYKKNHDFFNELLQNIDPTELLDRGKEYGIDLSAHLMIAVIEMPELNDLEFLEYNVHRIISLLKDRLAKFNMLIFGFHNKVTLLFSLSNIDNKQEVIHFLNITVEQWMKNQKLLLFAGTSSLYNGIEHINTCFSEANNSIFFAKNIKRHGLIQYEEIGINRLFLGQSPKENHLFLTNILKPLQTKYAQNSDLEQTLFTYIALNKSPGKTAKELHIHINTLYQRLNRIEGLLGFSFSNAEEMLKIQLACHYKNTFTNGFGE